MVVSGSQAILATYSEDELPERATVSMEADIAFRDDPDETKADRVDGSIGEGSDFHSMYAYYGQGVSVTTACLPDGWQDRLVPYDREDAQPCRAACLDAYDLVVSKLVAGREKDFEFAAALIDVGLVSTRTLVERAALLPMPGAVATRVRNSVDRLRRK